MQWEYRRGTGESWDGTKNLKELLKQENYPEEFRDIVPDYSMNLLEIQRFEHLEQFQTDLYLVFGFLQRRWDKEQLREFIEKNKERFQDLREDAGIWKGFRIKKDKGSLQNRDRRV